MDRHVDTPDNTLSKIIFYGEMRCRKGSQGGQKKRFTYRQWLPKIFWYRSWHNRGCCAKWTRWHTTLGKGTVKYGHSTLGKGAVTYGQSTFGKSAVTYGHSTLGKGAVTYGQSTLGKGAVTYEESRTLAVEQWRHDGKTPGNGISGWNNDSLPSPLKNVSDAHLRTHRITII